MYFNKRTILLALVILIVAGVSAPLSAWVGPITVAAEDGKIYEDKVAVQFHPSGAVYMAFMAHDEALARKDIYLYKYAGGTAKGELLGKVSAGKKYAYEPHMVITDDGVAHIVWAECDNVQSETQLIMYRSYDNGNFSPITTFKQMTIPGVLDLASFNKEKIDDLNVDVDESGNIFVAFMTWPAGRAKVLSKYGDNATREEPYPLAGRSKHPCVQVDNNYVYLVWQQLLGAYTVYFARRPNIDGAQWVSYDVKGGIHRPVMGLDQNGTAHIAYMSDDADKRQVVYKYWTGNGFSPRETLSEMPLLYQNVQIAVRDNKNMIVSAGIFMATATSFVFNWRRNGKWNPDGMVGLPGASGAFDNPASALSSTGIGAFVYNHDRGVFLIISEPLVINALPVAVITADKESVYWDEEINFGSTGSYDPDGSIVKYEWKIIQDNVTMEGPSITYRFNKSYNNVRVRLTAIDDKGGRGSVEKIIDVNALYTAPCTWSKQQVKTLVFNREGNVIQWQPNPKNEAAGFIIVKYKIFRREAGGDFQEIAEVDGLKRSFADVGIEAGKTYEYAVSSVDDQGRKSPYDNF
jgi:hypothetical protein